MTPAPCYPVGGECGVTIRRRHAEAWRLRWRRDCGVKPEAPTAAQNMQCWQRLTQAFWFSEVK